MAREPLLAGDEQHDRVDPALEQLAGRAAGERELALARPGRLERRAGRVRRLAAEGPEALDLPGKERRARGDEPGGDVALAPARAVARAGVGPERLPPRLGAQRRRAGAELLGRHPRRLDRRGPQLLALRGDGDLADRVADPADHVDAGAVEVPGEVGRVAQRDAVAVALQQRAHPRRLVRSLAAHSGGTIIGAMSYREHAPPADLAHVLTCTWRRVGRGEEVLVLPDGCVDVVVAGGRAHVAGPDTEPASDRGGGRRDDRGRALPARRGRGGARRARRGAARPARAARGPLGRRPAARPASARATTRVALLAALARRLREAAPDPRVLAAARRLDRAPGTRVPALADALGLGERQLRRRFTEGVGYGPKTFARIARFRAALALLRGGAAAGRGGVRGGLRRPAAPHARAASRSRAARPPLADPGGSRARRSLGRAREADRPVVADRPGRVVRDLPRVAVGVEEDARVAAPERLGARPPDRPAGRLGLARARRRPPPASARCRRA